MARPSKYSEEVAERIAAGIRLGLTSVDAAHLVGISEPTFHRWMGRYESFENLIAHAQRAARYLAKIQECGSADLRMWLALLERCHPEYRLRSAVELSCAEGGPLEIVGIELPLPVRQDDGEPVEPFLNPLPTAYEQQ